jgi:N-acylglucosamine-6-phosphate 2-epimerase
MTAKKKWDAVSRLEGGLIASCQASAGEPLCAPEHILALALATLNGGAIALRLEGTENIKYVRGSAKVPASVPIVGLIKSDLIADEDRLHKAYITSTFAEAESIARAGADIVALDATGRARPDGSTLEQMIKRIHKELDKPVWADCARFEEAVTAAAYGADIVSTTLFGYTAETASAIEPGPALDMLSRLLGAVSVPVILEGRIWHPDELTAAFLRGAYAVVVGSAITRPTMITERFVKAIPVRQPSS